MKITFFLNYLGGGGGEAMIINLSNYFVNQGYQVDYLMTKEKGDYLNDSIRNSDGVNHVYVQPKSKFIGKLHLLNRVKFRKKLFNWFLKNKTPRTLRCVTAVEKYFESDKPDVVFCMLPFNTFTAIEARRSLGKNTPKIIMMQVIQHTEYIKLKYKENTNLAWLEDFAVRSSLMEADKVISLADHTTNDLIEINRECLSNIETIYPPIDLKTIERYRYEEVDEYKHHDENTSILVAAGRLVEQKSFDTLLQAFSKAVKIRSNIVLYLLGQGPLEASLKDLAVQLGVSDKVYFIGFKNNIYKYFHYADLFVMSSKAEGCPMAMVEALACGCNVVSTDCPSGPREILNDGKYGKLVPMGDAVSLSKAMLEMLVSPNKKEFQEEAAQRYGLESIGSSYTQLISKVLS